MLLCLYIYVSLVVKSSYRFLAHSWCLTELKLDPNILYIFFVIYTYTSYGSWAFSDVVALVKQIEGVRET